MPAVLKVVLIHILEGELLVAILREVILRTIISPIRPQELVAPVHTFMDIEVRMDDLE
jgi:hypothetical protein